MDDATKATATHILQKGLKLNHAQLSNNQLRVISHLVDDGKDVLYIDKTGAGKSETYFVATQMLRDRDKRAGPVIVVTPLITLIDDQVRRAEAFGLQAAGYFSKAKGMNDFEQASVVTKLTANRLDLLFLTAEMLKEISKDNSTFNGYLYTHKLLKGGPALMRNPPMSSSLTWEYVPLLVIDEIHYIAEAGNDFRLAYAQVWSELANHPWYKRARKLGLTATVNKRVRESLCLALPAIKDWSLVLGSLYRENIALRIVPKPPNNDARLDYIRKLREADRDANILVFCKTINDVKEFSEKLGGANMSVGYYHSPASSDLNQIKFLKSNEEAFRHGKLRVLFSTCALGLGYDKKDIDHVVHLWTPNSMVQYYQELGRAGRSRDQQPAKAHMLPTTPWNPTGWAAMLSDICWFLAHQHPINAIGLQQIKERGVSLEHKESDIDRAIELGIMKQMLVKGEDDMVHLLDMKKSLQKADKIFADHMKEEVAEMYRLSRNCGQDLECMWRFVLERFEGHHDHLLACKKCSGQACAPGGDIAPSLQSSNNYYYAAIAPLSKVQIVAFEKVGDDLLIDEERVKEIFWFTFPSMVIEPPAKWTICPIPDSTGENYSKATTLAKWLNGMEVSYFIKKNPNEKRSVKGALSQSQRREILSDKFIFDWAQMPTCGNVLLYDDSFSSGDTIDQVVFSMRGNGNALEIVALTDVAYIGKALEVKKCIIP